MISAILAVVVLANPSVTYRDTCYKYPVVTKSVVKHKPNVARNLNTGRYSPISPRTITVHDTVRMYQTKYVPTYLPAPPLKQPSFWRRYTFPLIAGAAIGYAICKLTDDDNDKIVRVGYPVPTPPKDDDEDDDIKH